MGCGKSSVGRRLSQLLCCRFMDLDSVIGESEGRSIPEIFASDGETAFRRMEAEALSYILGDMGCLVRSLRSPHILQETTSPQDSAEDTLVLSLGGGTVMTRECAEMVRENTVCVYLRASVETLVRNLQCEAEGRPMLQGAAQSCTSDEDKGVRLRSRIEELMDQRSATYENTAHIIIDTDGRPIDSIAEEIISRL